MQANKFVKEYGWDAASNIVDGWIYRDFDDSYHIADGIYCNLPFEPTDDCGTLSLYDLKRLVKSYELVQRHETSSYSALENAKQHVLTLAHIEEYEKMYALEKAIADVESCL